MKEQGTELFILSNNFAERTKYYNEHFPFLKELFEKIYYSWQTGFIKPDPRALQNLLKENSLEPGECVYFDDSENNIKIAAELGIKSFVFKDVKTAEKIIKIAKQ